MDSFICPCCKSEIGIDDDDGSLYVMGQLSKAGVRSVHSGDQRWGSYFHENHQPAPPAAIAEQPPDEILLDGNNEILVDDRTAALVHRALVQDLFNRGLISTSTDLP